MAFEYKATLTNLARQLRATQSVTGEPAWKIIGFSVGVGGFDPLDTTVALAPPVGAEEVESQIFGIEKYDAVEWLNIYTPVFVCRLEQTEAVGQLGNLGLWAEITSGPDTGTQFLAVLVHYPAYNKTSAESKTFRIVLPQ